MKKVWVILAAAISLTVLAGIAGCGQKEEMYLDESDSFREAGQPGGEGKSEAGGKGGETGAGEAGTMTGGGTGAVKEEQDQGTEEDIDTALEAYRTERENLQGRTIDGCDLAILPNEENYGYGVGECSYTARFDSRELSLAFEEAIRYVEEELQADGSSVWICADPRMVAIYEDPDKGVAEGYDADNIFLCEYQEQGKWQYLILVREKKGADWSVLYHGSHYKTEE